MTTLEIPQGRFDRSALALQVGNHRLFKHSLRLVWRFRMLAAVLAGAPTSAEAYSLAERVFLAFVRGKPSDFSALQVLEKADAALLTGRVDAVNGIVASHSSAVARVVALEKYARDESEGRLAIASEGSSSSGATGVYGTDPRKRMNES